MSKEGSVLFLTRKITLTLTRTQDLDTKQQQQQRYPNDFSESLH